jgi:hypothetical protein
MNKYLMIILPLIFLPTKTYSQSGFGITTGTTSGEMSLIQIGTEWKDYKGIDVSFNMISGKNKYSIGGKYLSSNVLLNTPSWENRKVIYNMLSIYTSYAIFDIMSLPYLNKFDNAKISKYLKLSSSITSSLDLYDTASSDPNEGVENKSLGIGITANFVRLGYFVPHIGYEKFFGNFSSNFNFGFSLYFKTGQEKPKKTKKNKNSKKNKIPKEFEDF